LYNSTQPVRCTAPRLASGMAVIQDRFREDIIIYRKSRFRICRFLSGLSACIVLAGLILPSRVAAAEITVPYKVTIEGVEDRALLKSMEDVSDAVSLKDNPPASVALLRKRADRDKDQFIQLLRARGHYDARVESEVDAGTLPAQVTFRVTPGPAYVLKSFDLNLSGESVLRSEELPGAKWLGLSLSAPFRTEILLNAEKKLIENLGNKGFPFVKIPERKVIVDHQARSVSVVIRVDPGPVARFGPLHVTGLETTSETIIRRKIPWKEGDPYKLESLTLFQKAVIELGLFSAVTVSHADSLDERGLLPVSVAVKERKYRSIGAGVSYRTDEKLGLKFSWENRNLMGEGERLGLSATFSDLTYAAEGSFKQPFFFREDQSLTLLSRLAEDEPDAYTSRNLTSSAIVARDVTSALKIGGGVGFKEAQVTQLGEREDFSLLFLPLQLAWDRSDNLLDPTKGGRLGIQVAPYWDLFKEELQFTKARMSYGQYLKVLRSPSTVLAARINVAVVSGEERLEIPADERLYAGGGSSVRGYAYQSLAPRAEGIPTGGKSLLETSVETRVRITEQVGLVFFLDGGNAFAGITPSSTEDLFWGAGIGVRYFTPIGPFRFDIAVPLDRREGVDDAFQVYISIGQSF
jgi:translocation and assembly module TamA